MEILRLVALFSIFASVYSKVLIGKELIGLVTNREVTFEDDQLEYDIENGHGNYQGDMMLTEDQIAFMNGDGEDRSLAVSNWPRTGEFVNIPYTIDENNNWNAKEWQNIQTAMQEYHDKTCIRFVERTTEEDYIHIIHVHENPNYHGCWSMLGKQGGKQELSLWSNGNWGCAFSPGTPIHEFMHAIGYLHEQARSDRDQYVTINFENIKSGMASQFTKCEHCDLQGLPYDTGSVMHYHENAFSNGNGPTIVSLDGSPLGQRDGFSASDLEGINKVYCGGAPAPDTCQNTDDFGAEDPWGDNCDDYARNIHWCGNYDDDDFNSKEMCCACGGGNKVGDALWAKTSENVGCWDTEFTGSAGSKIECQERCLEDSTCKGITFAPAGSCSKCFTENFYELDYSDFYKRPGPACTDVLTNWAINKGWTCSTYGEKGRDYEKMCSKKRWIRKKICAHTCAIHGFPTDPDCEIV